MTVIIKYFISFKNLKKLFYIKLNSAYERALEL